MTYVKLKYELYDRFRNEPVPEVKNWLEENLTPEAWDYSKLMGIKDNWSTIYIRFENPNDAFLFKMNGYCE